MTHHHLTSSHHQHLTFGQTNDIVSEIFCDGKDVIYSRIPTVPVRTEDRRSVGKTKNCLRAQRSGGEIFFLCRLSLVSCGLCLFDTRTSHNTVSLSLVILKKSFRFTLSTFRQRLTMAKKEEKKIVEPSRRSGRKHKESPAKKATVVAKKATVAKKAAPPKKSTASPKKAKAAKAKKEAEKPKTAEELDREMDDYMMKNEKVAAKKLEEDMDEYHQKAKEMKGAEKVAQAEA
jgi:hypothetical protein